jgi:hypothetical protein
VPALTGTKALVDAAQLQEIDAGAMYGLTFGSPGRIRQATGLRIRRAVLRYSTAEFLDAAQPVAAHDRSDIGFLVTACEQPGMKALLTPLKYRRLARSVSLIGAD